eukprot:CAMPEP_0173248246 /NCGR_PEP_ID=MMETSP1142-20121109/18355_1 /TAXON_ID=483371 /ORGANISM="non described non described, Strain CCMP2298" /LENGTH=119 /DNA_ID=CAMNT_0014180737 /DNA_START=32 /DNA_END=392 /DNA_ORIENTATION=+
MYTAQQTVWDGRRGGERVGVQKRRELLLGAGAARSGLHSEDAPPGRPAAPDELVTSRSSSSQAPMELGLAHYGHQRTERRQRLQRPPHHAAPAPALRRLPRALRSHGRGGAQRNTAAYA